MRPKLHSRKQALGRIAFGESRASGPSLPAALDLDSHLTEAERIAGRLMERKPRAEPKPVTLRRFSWEDK